VFGFVATAIGVVLALWSFHEKRPNISFVTTADSNVLDVHTPMAALDVLYQGESIQRRNLNLRLLRMRVQNAGDVDIVQGAYDQKLPWGFRISNGRLIEIRVVGSNSVYLQSNLRPQQVSGNEVRFDKVIFDRGKFIDIQCLIVHPKDEEPGVIPFGKIAGLERLTAIRQTSKSRGQFLHETFDGSMQKQVARVGAYGVLFILVLLGVVGGSVALSELRERRRVRRRGRAIRAALEDSGLDELSQKLVTRLYVKQGSRGLEQLRDILTDPVALQRAVNDYDAKKDVVDRLIVEERERGGDTSRYMFDTGFYQGPAQLAGDLLNSGLVIRRGDGAASPTNGLAQAVARVLARIA
jgi:hypothetical protein